MIISCRLECDLCDLLLPACLPACLPAANATMHLAQQVFDEIDANQG